MIFFVDYPAGTNLCQCLTIAGRGLAANIYIYVGRHTICRVNNRAVEVGENSVEGVDLRRGRKGSFSHGVQRRRNLAI